MLGQTAHLVTNGGRSHFLFLWINIKKLGITELSVGSPLLGIHGLEKDSLSGGRTGFPSSAALRGPCEHSTKLCNDWSTGTEGPQQMQSLSTSAF